MPDSTLPPIDWPTALGFAGLIQIAYSVTPTTGYSDAVIAQIAAAGYTFLSAIYGSDLATDIAPHDGYNVTYGFLGRSAAGGLVVVLRGTQGILEWIHDAEFLWVPNPVPDGEGVAEDGFSAIYRSLRTGQPNNSPTVIDAVREQVVAGGVTGVAVTGHSLGGALATLMGLDVTLNSGYTSPTVYTFASPKVGYLGFCSQYNQRVPNTYRVYNRVDVVPTLPPLLYGTCGTPAELLAAKGALKDGPACAHVINTYLWLIGQKIAGSTIALGQGCQGPAYTG